MKLAIADGSDSALDSNVFIEAGSLVSGTQISTTLTGGAQTGAAITVPSGTAVHDSTTLSGVNIATAGGTVVYSVFSDPACQTPAGSGGTKTVTNGVVPDSDPITLNAAGTYRWIAAYSGDGTHNAVAGSCGDETVTVTGAANQPPTGSAGGPYTGTEGSATTSQVRRATRTLTRS